MYFQRKPRKALLATLLAAVLLSLVKPLWAIQSIELSLGRLVGTEWSTEDVLLTVDLSKSLGFSLKVNSFRHALFPSVTGQIVLECLKGELTSKRLTCDDGFGRIDHPLTTNKQFAVTFDWQTVEQKLQFSASDVPFHSGKANLELGLFGDHWQFFLKSKDQDIAKLFSIFPQLNKALGSDLIAGSGRLDINVTGGPERANRAEWSVGFSGVEYNNDAGSVFAENLDGVWRGIITFGRRGWESDQHISSNRGALLTPWFYMDTETDDLLIDTVLSGDSSSLTINRFQFNHKNTLNLRGTGVLKLGEEVVLDKMDVATESFDLNKVANHYFYPILGGTVWGQVAVSSGTAAVKASVGNGELSAVNANFSGADLEVSVSEASVLDLKGISGVIEWDSNMRTETSSLNWSSGSLYDNVALGPAKFEVSLVKDRMTLNQPAKLPVLDGHLMTEQFQADWGGGDPKIEFAGYLAPVSMSKLSLALGWPELHGKLSGMVPKATYEADTLTLDGIALAKLFEGDILLKNMQLTDLLEPLPVLSADIELKKLNLETLTETFSFGKITGRLDGEINSLRLEDWTPVAFDAWFATPEKGNEKRRISQRAVDNISNLGGAGISGALSRSFLRFFESFGYSKLGIRCRLENGTCQMGGVEESDRGYFLVKGGGLPRIDILGFNRETDWFTLVAKLKEITQGEPPQPLVE